MLELCKTTDTIGKKRYTSNAVASPVLTSILFPMQYFSCLLPDMVHYIAHVACDLDSTQCAPPSLTFVLLS